MSVTIEKKPFEAAERLVQLRKYLDTHVCLVGFWSNAKAAKSGISYKELAKIHEYGSGRVPARPFMKPGVESSRSQVAGMINANCKAVIEGKMNQRAVFTGPGLFLEGRIKRQFGNPLMAPLSPTTLRSRRGSSGAMPLLDTGNFRNSIATAVMPKFQAAGFTNA